MKTFHVWITILEGTSCDRILRKIVDEGCGVESCSEKGTIQTTSEKSISSVLGMKVSVDKLKDLQGKRTVVPNASLLETALEKILNDNNLSFLSVIVVDYTISAASWNVGNILPPQKQEEKAAMEEVEKVLSH